jgi:CBS domain-containing protein
MDQHESSHRPVREIMTSQVVAIGPQVNVREIARMMRDNNIGSVLVVEQNRLIGVISDRQLAISCLAEGKDPTACTAMEIMTRNPITVTPDTSEGDAIRLIGQHQIRRLPVVEDNTVVGIVSVADLAKDLENCPECIHDLASELSKAA